MGTREERVTREAVAEVKGGLEKREDTQAKVEVHIRKRVFLTHSHPLKK